NALLNVNFGYAERMVRINQLPAGLKDLDQITENVQTILVPKCESVEHIKQVDEYFNLIGTNNKQAENIFLIPIIESALGVVNAYEIASASKRICALAIGLEDYTADIGAARTKAGIESLFARCAVINAAKAAGIQTLDSVFPDLNDDEGLAASTTEAKALGFDGKGCIHPKQIKIIHNAFLPTEEEIEYARTIIAAYEDAVKNGSGVISIGSKMIDPPVIKRALKILKAAASSKKRS
ncbi:MAG: CoA ester lyase, partial [Ignavibacteria bacterium]|nr:CoA ester lyase [Ignavibacteria bacterium]